MAIIRGVIRLKGKVGNLVFTERNGTAYAKDAGPKGDDYDLSEGSKKSGKDFGASQTGRGLLHQGFKPFIKTVADARMDNRLKSVTIKGINTGPVTLQGKRKVTDGDVGLLKGFEFNGETCVGNLIGCLPLIDIDPKSNITIGLPNMRIEDLFFAPGDAADAILQFRCCSFFFDEGLCYFAMPEDLVIPLGKASFPGADVSLAITEETTEIPDDYVIMIAWTIQFAAADGGIIRDKQYYAGSILQSVYIKDGKIVVFQYPEPVKKEMPVEDLNRAAWKMRDNG